MKGLRELLSESEPSPKANAFGRNLRKDDGTHINVPGHVTDFVEQDGDTRTEFDPSNYANKGWNWTRNVKSKKKYDVYRRVSDDKQKFRASVVDKT